LIGHDDVPLDIGGPLLTFPLVIGFGTGVGRSLPSFFFCVSPLRSLSYPFPLLFNDDAPLKFLVFETMACVR